MKKYIPVLTIAVLAINVTSCGDFLDKQPEGYPLRNFYFTNDQQAIDGMDMLYARLHQENVFGREFFWEQGGGQDVVWGRTRAYGTLATLKYNGDEVPLRTTFEQFYATMARANYVILELKNKEKEKKLTAIEARTLGEAILSVDYATSIYPIAMEPTDRVYPLYDMKNWASLINTPFRLKTQPSWTTINR